MTSSDPLTPRPPTSTPVRTDFGGQSPGVVQTGVSASVRPSRILVVDDEPQVLELLTEVLAKAGYDVLAVGTGSEAVAVAVEFQPHVLLLDLMMPGMDGNQVLQALRESGIQAPAVAISGHPEHARSGFLAVLAKPLNIRGLPKLVAAAVRAGQADVGA
jgi:CheY-like chemotaxis protein